jgi:hypothetical protein
LVKHKQIHLTQLYNQRIQVWSGSLKGQSRYRPRGQVKTELPVPIKGTVLDLLERRAFTKKHYLKGLLQDKVLTSVSVGIKATVFWNFNKHTRIPHRKGPLL